MEVKRKQSDRSATTRRALLAAARDLFAERGFAATSVEAVVERAGMTKGALYHHFTDKVELFLGVFELMETELGEKIQSRAFARESAYDQLRVGLQAFLDLCLEPAVQRIVVLDAPAVLGWERWKEVEGRYGLNLLRIGLEAAIAAGQIQPQPVEPMAHLLLAAVHEAAMVIARAPNVGQAREEVGASVDRLIEGLRN